MGLYNDLIFTEAIEQVKALVTETDSDLMSDRIEQIAENQDLTLACLMLLTLEAKGIDTAHMNGIELANTKPTFKDLILPPGVKL